MYLSERMRLFLEASRNSIIAGMHRRQGSTSTSAGGGSVVTSTAKSQGNWRAVSQLTVVTALVAAGGIAGPSKYII